MQKKKLNKGPMQTNTICKKASNFLILPRFPVVRFQTIKCLERSPLGFLLKQQHIAGLHKASKRLCKRFEHPFIFVNFSGNAQSLKLSYFYPRKGSLLASGCCSKLAHTHTYTNIKKSKTKTDDG